MALIQMKYMSKALRMSTDITVTLPDYDPQEKTPERFPVLYLLHGFSGDSMDWLRSTSIERRAQELGLAVVMPCGYNSAYTDMAYGQNYFTYLSKELLALLAGLLPLTREAASTYVAGVSMGGYGAMKWALSCPEQFAAAVSFSGSLHVEDRIKGKSANSGNQCLGMYGDPPKILPAEQDLFVMLETLKKQGRPIPQLYICCGREDKAHIYGAYRDFKAHAEKLGVPLTAKEGPGAPTWEFWEEYLPDVLDWLPKSQ